MVGISGASGLRASLVTAKSPQATVTNIREHLRQSREEHLNLAAQKAGQRRTAAAIGNVADFDLRARFQQFAFNDAEACQPLPSAYRSMPGCDFANADQFGDGVGRDRRMHGQDFGASPKDRQQARMFPNCSRHSCGSEAR